MKIKQFDIEYYKAHPDVKIVDGLGHLVKITSILDKGKSDYPVKVEVLESSRIIFNSYTLDGHYFDDREDERDLHFEVYDEKEEYRYADLRDGYILKREDIVSVHGIMHKVVLRNNGYSFLQNLKRFTNNAEVFKLFGLERKQINDWAKKFDDKVDETGAFPEFSSLKKLTAFVKDIMERPLFQVGDCVEINVDPAESYQITVNDVMKAHKGLKGQITECRLAPSSVTSRCPNEDRLCYCTSADIFIYQSSMLKHIKRSEMEEEMQPVKVSAMETPPSEPVTDMACPVPPEETAVSDETTIQLLCHRRNVKHIVL